MPAVDSCIFWRLGGHETQVLCDGVVAPEGPALTVEHDGAVVLAEMVINLDAARGRADLLRTTLSLRAGMVERHRLTHYGVDDSGWIRARLDGSRRMKAAIRVAW